MNGEELSVWRSFGDSEIGSLHQRLGLPNQDAYYQEINNYPLLIALSDGLGSKPLSHLGAQAVIRAADRLAKYDAAGPTIEPLFLIKLFHKFWLEELRDEDVEQCRCTALFVIVWKEQTLIAQLGDGDCCIISSNQHVTSTQVTANQNDASKLYGSEQKVRFLAKENDDLFANQTHSLAQELQLSQWQFCLQPTAQLEACILATDGIADDLDLEHRDSFYIKLLNLYRHLSDEEIKADVRRWISQWPVAGHSDDKTIVALFR